MKKKGYKKPSWFIYHFIFKVGSKFYAKFKLNLKVLRNEVKRKKGPYVVIANHESVIDFMTLGSIMPRSNFVVSSSFYNTMPIKKLMKKSGVLPKQQFQTSPSDLKRMKEVVDNDMPLVIYPAGLMTEHGATTPIPESTVKFLKWLKQDVYVANIKGTYLSKPKWSKLRRKGKCFIDVYKLYSKEELALLSNDVLYNKLQEVLSFDAYENQEKLLIKYNNGDNLEGFENVLYKCPKCHKEFTIIAKGNKFECQNCGNSVIADCYGFLSGEKDSCVYFRHPSKWALKIKEELKNEIANNPNYFMSSECEIHLLNMKKRKYLFAGNGVVSLNHENIKLEGNISGEEFVVNLPSNQYISLPFSPGKCFEIQNKDISYRLYLKNGKEVTKWVWALQSLYELKDK